MQKHVSRKNIIFGVAILLLLLVVIYSGLRILKPTFFSSGEDDGVTDTSQKTIERDGVKYFPRQDITVFLIMGIDKDGKVEPSGSYNNDGAADVVALAVFDETAETYSVVCLNRDTMLEMPVLGIGGKKAGKTVAQLALSHTYGSGLEDSCENTKTAVSDYLYGLEIDYYLAFNMDAIGILTNSVGGVTVNVTDDFSQIDPTIQKGEVTLNADQAMNFVRTRKGVGDQMNLSRMDRHEEFMKGFFEALGNKLDGNTSFALKAFGDVSDYMVTDCSAEVLANYSSRYSDYTLTEIVSPEGENKSGTEYVEFYADEEKLDELILRVFYAPKE